MSTGSISGRMTKQTQDPLGRWVIQEFIGKQGRLLAVVSAYQTVEKRGTQGPLTVASQQKSLLIQMKDKVTNPRTAFRRDLLQTLRAYQDTGADLLVVGDFNEAFGSDSEGMSGIAISLQHVNLMSTRHSTRPPPTYARGSACLDYALASPKVSIALRKAGYDAFDARLPSDHRGYYLDFQTDLVWKSDTGTGKSTATVATCLEHSTSYYLSK